MVVIKGLILIIIIIVNFCLGLNGYIIEWFEKLNCGPNVMYNLNYYFL